MKSFIIALISLIALTLNAAETRVLIVVGPSSHPPGSHEVAAGGRVLQHCLERMENLPGVKVDLVEGWPTQALRDAAASIVFIGDFFPPNRLPNAAQNLEDLGVMMQRGFREGKSEELVWERLSPGHYQVTTTLNEGAPARGAVQVAGAAIPFGPVTVGSGSEWKFDRDRVTELRETARASGGSELVDLSKAWRKPPAPGHESIRHPLLVAALLLFLLEALVTRTGWRLPQVQFAGLAKTRAKKVKTPLPATEAGTRPPVAPTEPATDAPIDPASPAPVESRKSRFHRAKKGL